MFAVAGKVVSVNDTLFHYTEGHTFYTYSDLDFTPIFTSDLNITQDIRDTCNDDPECIFDLAVTRELRERTINLFSHCHVSRDFDANNDFFFIMSCLSLIYKGKICFHGTLFHVT